MTVADARLMVARWPFIGFLICFAGTLFLGVLLASESHESRASDSMGPTAFLLFALGTLVLGVTSAIIATAVDQRAAPWKRIAVLCVGIGIPVGLLVLAGILISRSPFPFQ